MGRAEHISLRPEVIEAGASAFKAAFDQAKAEGKTDEEADALAQEASLDARKQKIRELTGS